MKKNTLMMNIDGFFQRKQQMMWTGNFNIFFNHRIPIKVIMMTCTENHHPGPKDQIDFRVVSLS